MTCSPSLHVTLVVSPTALRDSWLPNTSQLDTLDTLAQTTNHAMEASSAGQAPASWPAQAGPSVEWLPPQRAKQQPSSQSQGKQGLHKPSGPQLGASNQGYRVRACFYYKRQCWKAGSVDMLFVGLCTEAAVSLLGNSKTSCRS